MKDHRIMWKYKTWEHAITDIPRSKRTDMLACCCYQSRSALITRMCYQWYFWLFGYLQFCNSSMSLSINSTLLEFNTTNAFQHIDKWLHLCSTYIFKNGLENIRVTYWCILSLTAVILHFSTHITTTGDIYQRTQTVRSGCGPRAGRRALCSSRCSVCGGSEAVARAQVGTLRPSSARARDAWGVNLREHKTRRARARRWVVGKQLLLLLNSSGNCVTYLPPRAWDIPNCCTSHHSAGPPRSQHSANLFDECGV